MKKNSSLGLLGLAVLGGGAYLWYRSRSSSTAASTPAPSIAATQMAGALGAYATGNPMMESLGVLGCSGQNPGVRTFRSP